VKILSNRIARKIFISGIVQGVGFRPFIYRLAKKFKLKGYVRNLGGSEVEVLIEGPKILVEEFIRSINIEKPRAAKIESLVVEEAAPIGANDFVILKSDKKAKLYSMIPPDFGVCEYCLSEVLDPNSRHYRYPFNSCAWCGPRFSIIEKLPYDRENTSMRDFPLCEDCMREYTDPTNIRRFHIQGISCPKCGPKVWLATTDGEKIEVDDPITEAAKLVDEGYIIAVKGLGGFHIAALATDDDVVLKLRKRKRRRYKPFALMALDIEVAQQIVEIDSKAREILESPEKPIVLLPEKDDSSVSKYVAPGLDKQGVMLPYTPLHYLLLKDTRDRFLIMTSGNKKGKPMCTDEQCAITRLSGIVDFFLFHNRRIINRVDDSVVRFTDGELTFLRRSRGYAPVWIRLPFKLNKKIIAFGAELQNAGAVGFDDKVVLTQFIGDTDEIENLDYLNRALKFFSSVYEIDPSEAILVADKHPRYASRLLAEKWAHQYKSKLVHIQHHYAHIVSVLAEKKFPLDSKVIGIAIDGLGYGDDGQIWGGEIFVASYKEYIRVGHLEYHYMPGGDLAVIYPIRMVISILSKFMEEEEIIQFLKKRNLIKGLRKGVPELKIVFKQLATAPRTSSLGRVLDAASHLLNICYERTYEGEPAIKLEAAAKNGRLISELLEIPIKTNNGKIIIQTSKLFENLVNNLHNSKNDLAYTIQLGLGLALGRVASDVATRYGIDHIVVSGGAAVNSYIVKGIKTMAKEKELTVLLPNKVPAGDGGIALGQVAIAGAKLLENS